MHEQLSSATFGAHLQNMSEDTQTAPFKSYRTIFEQEVQQAVEELKRPAHGLFISGLLAGFGVGLGVFVLAVMLTRLEGTLPEPISAILLANTYTFGFILVIMGRTDLFTEYTTIAILPILTANAPLLSLGRLWSLVYLANLVGCAAFAGLLAVLGPALGVVDPEVFGQMAHELIGYSWWVIFLSAFLAGWLMGILSWLVTAGRESISQIFFIWLITGAIGFGNLHHAITGTIEVLVGLLTQQDLLLMDFGYFLLWTTLGNAVGGAVFAILIRYSVLLGNSGKDKGLRKN